MFAKELNLTAQDDDKEGTTAKKLFTKGLYEFLFHDDSQIAVEAF